MRIAFTETTEYHINHPITKKPLFNSNKDPMLAIIHGSHTSVFKDAVIEMNSKITEKTTKEEKKEYSNILLSECTIGFKNIEVETELGVVDGESNESCLAVFWIKEQVDDSIMSRELFLEPSKTT